ncbi:DUF6165 family protein [Wenxinia saemankumensis]|uniref:Uncharacterized protein n=1 Tax=Wenxinia saemankumensis TaxID=1447782 RepID=A0A1M6FQK0_9RHOB|nr:DUF6165 family protein [Wenxinia saemankumensis]SHI99925.1 hypothetical protein SAMN05444417_2445 [Wenxinia saemankumensis]
MKEIRVPVSPGELIDKLTILRLKEERIEDEAKLANIRRERAALQAVAEEGLPDHPDLPALEDELYGINARLWQVEDDIRAFDAQGYFGPDYIALARAVYQTNDRRAEVKRQINLALGSDLLEEKSYAGEAGPGAA